MRSAGSAARTTVNPDRPGIGSVKLNRLEAMPTAQLIEIEVTGGGTGWIVLVLPDGWAADAEKSPKDRA
jgi:hypothetical protein